MRSTRRVAKAKISWSQPALSAENNGSLEGGGTGVDNWRSWGLKGDRCAEHLPRVLLKSTLTGHGRTSMISRERPAADAQWIRLSRRLRRTAARFSSRKRCRRRTTDKTGWTGDESDHGRNSRLRDDGQSYRQSNRTTRSFHRSIRKLVRIISTSDSPFRLIGRRPLTRLI